MRYLCRPPGKPPGFDDRFPGCYNARRDNLRGFWSDLYGRNHGVMVIDSFFENVPRHLYERRELSPGERESNLVLHFNPNTGVPMAVACVWSHWTGENAPELYSFAAITDTPPAEILATGHTRCVISLKDENVRSGCRPPARPAIAWSKFFGSGHAALRAPHRRLKEAARPCAVGPVRHAVTARWRNGLVQANCSRSFGIALAVSPSTVSRKGRSVRPFVFWALDFDETSPGRDVSSKARLESPTMPASP